MREFLQISLDGLTSYLAKRAYMRTIRRVIPRNRYAKVKLLGNKMAKIDRMDLEQVYMEADCVREPENIFIYRALANAGLCNTFIDVGANYGHVASKIYNHYQKVILIDANPNATSFLCKLFNDHRHVEIKSYALVGNKSVKNVTLMVPESSSGLAHLSTSTGFIRTNDEIAYECAATTLDLLFENDVFGSAYVKIDVEGFESSVIQGGQMLIRCENVIVGFEALSHQAAAKCCSQFPDHCFYFGRLDFLDLSGALNKSIFRLLYSIIFGGNIAIYKFTDIKNVKFDNFSQIVAVPMILVEKFEAALCDEHIKLNGKMNLSKL